MQGPETETGAGEPDDGPGARRRTREPGLGRVPASPRARPGGAGLLAMWLGWIRNQPVLAAAFLGFCLVAVGGLVLTLPRGTLSVGRHEPEPPGCIAESRRWTQTPIAPREAPVSRAPNPRAAEAPSARARAWPLGPRGAIGTVAARPGPRLSLPDAAAGRRVPVRVDRSGARRPAGAGRGRGGDLADGACREERRRPYLPRSRGRRVSAVRRRARRLVRRVREDPLSGRRGGDALPPDRDARLIRFVG